MSDMALNILLVEDNLGDATLLQEILVDVPNIKFEITHVQRLSEALDKATADNFDVVLLDLSLPDCQGLDTVNHLRQRTPQLPIVVLTGINDEMLGSEAVRRGAQDYLVKGEISGRLLSRSIRYATERARSEADLRAAHDLLEIRVRQRTAELEQALDALQDEVQIRTQTEEALRESEELFRQMAEATPEVFWIASPDMSKILYVNASFERMWSQARSKLLHDPNVWMRQILPEDQSRVTRAISHWLEEARRGDDEPLSIEYHLVRSDGEQTMVHGRYFAIRDDRGRLLRVCGIVQDITERHNREQARRRLAAIVESTSDGIVSTSSDGTIQTWNAGAEILLGYISAEAVGRSILTLVPPDRQTELADRLAEVRQKQTIDAFETACLRKNGQIIQVQVTFSPIVESTGQLA
ncbi:MAG: PAS domain S-box protein, partial [Planctomycetaceae bacterium]